MLDSLWVLVCPYLVFWMQLGFMCLESGLTPSKNNINVAIKNLEDVGVSAFCFWLVGYGFMFGSSIAEWLGKDYFVHHWKDLSSITFFLFQVMFCGTASTIISGAIAERIRFRAYLSIVAMMACLVYPVFGHWAWNGINGDHLNGWLGNLEFIDFTGSTVVHSIGAWVA